MDIYKYAEEIDYSADYYDPHTGNIFKIQEYKDEKDIPDAKIRVVDSFSGLTVGYAIKKIKYSLERIYLSSEFIFYKYLKFNI